MSAKLLGRTGATAGRDFPLADLARLGASPENEIRITAPGVSRRHARIWRENDQFYVEDVGATNGTFLNGGRIQRETLRHLDVITLGREVDLIFVNRGGGAGEAAPSAVAADQIRSVSLQLLDGPDAGTMIEVPKGELSFGRSETCNVVLASRAIGKLHARMQRTGNQLVLQDLQSVNGTFVNGARVDVAVLANGDTINFAGVRSVMVTIDGTAAAVSGSTGAPVPQAMSMPAFDQEWKTRFMWSPDELAAIEAARKDAQALADMRSAATEQKPAAKPPAAAAKPAAAAPGAGAAKPAAAPQKPAAPTPSAPPPAAKPAAPAPVPAGGAEGAAPTVAVPPRPVVQPPAPAQPAEAAPKPPTTAAPPAAKPAVPATPPAGGLEGAAPTVPVPPRPVAQPPAPAPPMPPAEAAPKPSPPIQPAKVEPVPPKPPEAAKAQPVSPKPPEAAKAVPQDETAAVPPAALAQASRSENAAAAHPAPRIRAVRLVSADTTVKLGLGTFMIGRTATADVRLEDRQVSRQHATITVTEATVTVEDLQTVNGTLVNGREVKGREVLRDGDTVLFGASEFKVEVIAS